MTRSGVDVWRLHSRSRPHRTARLPSLRHRQSKQISRHPLSPDSCCAARQLPLQNRALLHTLCSPRYEKGHWGRRGRDGPSLHTTETHAPAGKRDGSAWGQGPDPGGAPTKTRVSVTHMHMRVYTHRPSFRRPDGDSAPTGCSHGARARDWPSHRAPHATAWGRLGTDTARPRGLADPGPAPRRGRGQATYLWPASSTDPHSRTRTLCRADLEPSKAVQPLGGYVRPL